MFLIYAPLLNQVVRYFLLTLFFITLFIQLVTNVVGSFTEDNEQVNAIIYVIPVIVFS